jgi:hypothetical protein
VRFRDQSALGCRLVAWNCSGVAKLPVAHPRVHHPRCISARKTAKLRWLSFSLSPAPVRLTGGKGPGRRHAACQYLTPRVKKFSDFVAFRMRRQVARQTPAGALPDRDYWLTSDVHETGPGSWLLVIRSENRPERGRPPTSRLERSRYCCALLRGGARKYSTKTSRYQFF